MLNRGVSFLCLCIVAMLLLQEAVCLRPVVDPEVRAHLEAKVISSMSLKDIEAMVENDERVMNAPKSKLIIIPKGRNADGLLGADDREAIIIHRKPKKSFKRADIPEYSFDFDRDIDFDRGVKRPSFDRDIDFDRGVRRSSFDRDIDFDRGVRRSSFDRDIDFDRGDRRSSYEPAFRFDSEFRHEEDDFPSFFKISDMESAHSTPVRQFYESIVDSVMSKQKFGLAKDPFAVLDMAASESVPQYKPRFDYDAYSKDSTETKLQGKPYWKDAPERSDEMVDENGCRTVVKRIVDPEDEKKSSSENAKSVVITKECEYPNINGPDAKIVEATPLRHETSRYDSPQPSNYDNDQVSYDRNRPEELDIKQSEGRDPIAPDYIDSMLDKHFKSFPGFSNPLTSFRGYQERFKLRIPEGFKDIKPTVGVQTYEYSHPKSGFDEERQSQTSKDSVSNDSPKTFDHRFDYDYPQHQRKPEYDDDREDKPAEKSSDSKDPKMLKKSFAYYRKDNPKSDPNDHQYAEEYAHGNYRSFSSSYDSEKDGPKKE